MLGEVKKRAKKFKAENLVQLSANLFTFFLIYRFLFYYFKPELLLSKVITTGGDTGSHYYPALYMRNYLLPRGKLTGWCPGNYAGFPIFQFYFPLLFVFISLLSYLVPMQISFKIATVLGTFLLPLTSFLTMSLMGFEFPLPALAAVFSLAFLFHQGNSMWGGNIPSTLAGEFSYSFSFALSFLFLGLLWKGIRKGKYHTLNSVLIALIGLSHVYTLLFVVLASAYFIVSPIVKGKRKLVAKNFLYLFRVYLLAFLLLAFWYLPMLAKLEYTTPYSHKWILGSNERVLPKVLRPFFVLSCLGFISALRESDERLAYLLFCALSSILLFYLAPFIGGVDIRFVPFLQYLLVLLSPLALSPAISRLKAKSAVLLVIAFLTLFWVKENVTYIPYWIKWNYEGFEGKSTWEQLKEISSLLRGNLSSPRVVYEHNEANNMFGTIRVFESLPLFANRSTLEGLYMQSSISAPFVFYIQSEISEQRSCPFWRTWECTSFNLSAGIEHLKLFNVREIIAVSERAKRALRERSDVKLKGEVGRYEIYEIENVSGNYVEVLSYEPILVETGNWKRLSYNWFKSLSKVHLAFTRKASQDDAKYFRLIMKENEINLSNLPKIEVGSNCTVKEIVRNEEIVVFTNCIRKPHLIKISYFPNWRVEGARKIYLVSPSFMLVFPERKVVRLYYASTPIDEVSKVLTALGIAFLFYELCRSFVFVQNFKRARKR